MLHEVKANDQSQETLRCLPKNAHKYIFISDGGWGIISYYLELVGDHVN